MTYNDNINHMFKPFLNLQDEEGLCFECEQRITGAVVSYDGHASSGLIKSIYFHPKCANLVGQRLIADGFKNRRKE